MRTFLRRRRSAVALILLTPLALVVMISLPVPIAQGATLHTACQASQIRLSVSATEKNATYEVRTSTGLHNAFAYELVPVHFYNRGRTCHLLMGGPNVQFVRHTTNVARLTNRDWSVPSPSANNGQRVLISRHETVEALVVIVKPVGKSFRGCEPATVTGFRVGDYANPISATYFVPRKLNDICFDVGVGRTVEDFGIQWTPT